MGVGLFFTKVEINWPMSPKKPPAPAPKYNTAAITVSVIRFLLSPWYWYAILLWMITPELWINFIYFSSKLGVLKSRVCFRWEGVPDTVYHTAGQRDPAARTQDVPNPPHELAVRGVPVAAEMKNTLQQLPQGQENHTALFATNQVSVVFSLLPEKLFSMDPSDGWHFHVKIASFHFRRLVKIKQSLRRRYVSELARIYSFCINVLLLGRDNSLYMDDKLAKLPAQCTAFLKVYLSCIHVPRFYFIGLFLFVVIITPRHTYPPKKTQLHAPSSFTLYFFPMHAAPSGNRVLPGKANEFF